MKKEKSIHNPNKHIIINNMLTWILTLINLLFTIFNAYTYYNEFNLEKALAMPNINLSWDNSEDLTSKIVIKNNGGIIKNIDIKVYPFLYGKIDNTSPTSSKSITFFDGNGNIWPCGRILPVDESLMTNIFYNNAQDILATIEINNRSLIIQDINKLENNINKEDTVDQICNIKVIFFLVVSYTDMFDNENSNYYYTDLDFDNPQKNRTALNPKIKLLQEQTLNQNFYYCWLKSEEDEGTYVYNYKDDDSQEIRIQNLKEAMFNCSDYDSP